jgi:small membrane protein
MNLFQWIAVPVFVVSAAYCVLQFLRGRLAWRPAGFWTLLWTVAAALVLRPSLASSIAHAFGIGRGADFALYIGVTLALYLAWASFVRYRRLEVMLTELVRDRAIAGARRGGSSASASQG